MKQGYLEYKESGYEWLGEIPLHWELKKAKWSFKEKSIKGYPDELLLSVSKGKGVIPRGELENKTVMAFKDLQNFKLVLPEDFVIHLRSFQSGFEMSMNKGIVSPAYTVFSCKNGLLPSYYKFLFYMQNFIDAIASTTQSLRDGKPIAYRDFSNMVLPFPKYNEQVKIANFLKVKLKEVDNLIYTKKKLILLLEQQRQSIITEAVTKGLNPNVKLKDSGVEWIGEIPEHWALNKIKYCVNLLGEKAEEQTTLQYLGLENIESKTGRYIPTEDVDIDGSAIKFFKGNVLFGKLRPYLTKVLLAEFNGRCSTEILVLETLSSIINNAYLKSLLLTPNFIDEINSSTYGSKMPRANWSFIGNTLIPLPPLSEQEVIVKEIMEVDERYFILISKLKNQIEKLKEYRQALIYEAVTGKIDVRDMELDEVR
ncbi:restriction endonuclease subunit S [Bacillus altitudinis]|uniref:restriction endonuclease subunit S n=1 Tax=Bacillus altitudinis TaxID=293387 RepID=UPI0025707969|nr:restriction endonuclease subunit S [Bacillus altitudinis]WJE29652.1 restriction endonuclease subunit S [Bacillus altitudinis]